MSKHFEDGGRGVRVGDAILFDKIGKTIRLYKPRLAPEDVVALRFSRVLEGLGMRYVVVAGYTAILFGRARRSDDIDFIVDYISEDGFVRLCKEASREGFMLMQGDISSEESVRRIYRGYLALGYGVRFMLEEIVLPNVELKFATTSVHRYAIDHGYLVIVNGEHALRISPLELQIAYKLYLGSDKDVGDAVFLYELFKGIISWDVLRIWCERLGVPCDILEGGEDPRQASWRGS